MPVYIVQGKDPGPVKIGWANDMNKRLRSLQIGQAEQITILRLIDGIRPLESAFHQRFKDQRIRGEWFHFHPDMLTVTFPEFEAPKDDPAERLPASVVQDWGDSRSTRGRNIWEYETDELFPDQIACWLVSSIDEPPPPPWEGDEARAYSAAKHHRDLRRLITLRRNLEAMLGAKQAAA